MMTGIAGTRFNNWQVVLLAVLASSFFSLQASISLAQVSAVTPETSVTPVHPVYGKALKTIASDEHLTQLSTRSDGTMREALNGSTKQNSVSRVLKRTNLVIDNVELQWSGGGSNFGYLYFCAPGPPLPLWEFAACSKPNLTRVSPEDLATRFVSFADRTNRTGTGEAIFGTNWVRNGIRVRQGQVVLARLAGDRSKVFVLEFTKQTPTNAEVFYIETSVRNQLTNGVVGPDR